MSFITKAISSSRFLLKPDSVQIEQIRNKAVKAVGTCKNPPKHPKPKHRGWKRQDGHFVPAGCAVATQRTLRWLPGLNVGILKDGTLYALCHGWVVVTCEQPNLDFEHAWVKRDLSHQEGRKFYKKYWNIIPYPENQRFRLVDEV